MSAWAAALVGAAIGAIAALASTWIVVRNNWNTALLGERRATAAAQRERRVSLYAQVIACAWSYESEATFPRDLPFDNIGQRQAQVAKADHLVAKRNEFNALCAVLKLERGHDDVVMALSDSWDAYRSHMSGVMTGRFGGVVTRDQTESANRIRELAFRVSEAAENRVAELDAEIEAMLASGARGGAGLGGRRSRFYRRWIGHHRSIAN
jgi:hypothetical protein